MSKSNTAANDYLRLLYNATAIANLADNAATAPLTNIQVALHTASPLRSDTQQASEANYTGYARVAVPRTVGGWTVTGDTVVPVATIPFGACTAGTNEITHWSTGVAASGATKIQHIGVLGSRLGAFTATVADVVTLPGTTLAVNDRVAFYAAEASALPAGITEGTVYFVKTATGADITISTTSGGATLDITAVGDGVAYRITPIAVSAGVTPSLTNATFVTEY